MAVGTEDWLCWGCGEGDDMSVDGVASSAPDVVGVRIGGCCVVAAALAEGTATLQISTSRGHVTVVVEAVRADSFVLLHDSIDGEVLGPGPTDMPPLFSFEQWNGTVEWRAGDRALRGFAEGGFVNTDPSVLSFSLQLVYPLTGGSVLGMLRIYLTRLAPGTTQLMWNDVPGPILVVQ